MQYAIESRYSDGTIGMTYFNDHDEAVREAIAERDMLGAGFVSAQVLKIEELEYFSNDEFSD